MPPQRRAWISDLTDEDLKMLNEIMGIYSYAISGTHTNCEREIAFQVEVIVEMQKRGFDPYA